MHELDGSRGGGQLLRTALALSVLTGEPFRMEAVRENRPKPGVKAQHLAAVRAAAAACDASTDGTEVGATTVGFDPGSLVGGEVRVDVGTAGSVALVFDAVLPVAYGLDERLRVQATGGTHVRWAPTMEHYTRAKLPLLAATGLNAGATVHRAGFYPAGGGAATLTLDPSDGGPLDHGSRGALRRLEVRSVATEDLADASVARRQARALSEALGEDALGPVETTTGYVEADSTGSALFVLAEYEGGRAGFDALGARGKRAEAVADEVAASFRRFRRSDGAVDVHTADQLMVPLAVGGGVVAIPEVTDHVASNAQVIRAFGGDLRVEGSGEGRPRLVSRGGLGR